MSKDSSKNEPPKAKAPADSEAPVGPFAWVKPAFKSRRTIKTWIRCCVAFAAAVTLMVCRKTSDTMGQAAFFCVIVAVMLPPTLALSVFLVAGFTLLFGMLLGWAWGNAAMASALAARSSALLAQQKQKLVASIDPNQSVALQTQIFIFHGNFLDPWSSTVYGVFLFVGAFLLGAVRAYLPNLTILSIFGTIVLDVICTTGPLLPTANYTLAKLFIIPTSFYVATAIGSLVLVFPESLSHVWMTSLGESFWNPILDMLRLQSEALNLTPSDTDAWAQMNARGVVLRERLTAGLNEVTSQIKLINLDTSIGRLGPSDLKKINAELKSVMFRASGLHSFSTFVNDINVLEAKELKPTTVQASSGTQTPRAPNRYQALLSNAKERELMHGHDLDSLVPILQVASANIRASIESSLRCVVDWFQESNSRRLTGLFMRKDIGRIQQRQQILVDQLKELVAAQTEFRLVERTKLIKPYEKFFDPETKLFVKTADLFSSRSLYICFVFIDTFDAFAERMADILKIVINIDAQRATAKVWFPGRISTLKENIIGDDFEGFESPFCMGSSQDPASFDAASNGGNESNSTLDYDGEEDEGPRKAAYRDKEEATKDRLADAPIKRNPDAFPPKTSGGRLLHKLAPMFRFFKSPEGILALRSGIVSVALWIPAVCHQTAWFYYDNKGIWALIMAQTALATYAGNQIAGFVLRLSGTIVGLLIGMTVWYIGAGLGHGNPYGIVIASTIVLSPFLLARISAPPWQVTFWLMTSVTIVFVTGYSWINANQFILANTGVGVSIGWKRALLVIIGFTAALIVMLFPNPMSSRVLVRKTLAAIAGEVGHIFAGEIEAFLAEETRTDSDSDGENSIAMSLNLKEKRVKKIAGRVIAVGQRLRYIQPSLTTARFEPQLAGAWPHDLYKELFALQERMLGALGILIVSFSKLDTKWCSALVHRTAYLNPNFLSDIFMTITILSNSLMGGHTLPSQLPRLRDRLVYHDNHSGGRFLNTFLRKSSSRRAGPQNVDETVTHMHTDIKPDSQSGQNNESKRDASNVAGPSHIDVSAMGIELDGLTLDVLFNEQLPAYSTAIVAFSSLITRIDEMADIVRTLCGEATFQGYEALLQDYMDREERDIGRSGLAFSAR